MTMDAGRQTAVSPALWASYTNWFRHVVERNKRAPLFAETLAPILLFVHY